MLTEYLHQIQALLYYQSNSPTYNRTARADKKEKVSEIVRVLLVQSSVYLRHRSHVDNISKVLPFTKEAFNVRYIALDFSKNLAMKPKIEAQDALFSGKQFTLHCAIVLPGQPKYVYHLSDDTTYDSFFVHEVLRERSTVT